MYVSFISSLAVLFRLQTPSHVRYSLIEVLIHFEQLPISTSTDVEYIYIYDQHQRMGMPPGQHFLFEVREGGVVSEPPKLLTLSQFCTLHRLIPDAP